MFRAAWQRLRTTPTERLVQKWAIAGFGVGAGVGTVEAYKDPCVRDWNGVPVHDSASEKAWRALTYPLFYGAASLTIAFMPPMWPAALLMLLGR